MVIKGYFFIQAFGNESRNSTFRDTVSEVPGNRLSCWLSIPVIDLGNTFYPKSKVLFPKLLSELPLHCFQMFNL